jgi:hypothetical protein
MLTKEEVLSKIKDITAEQLLPQNLHQDIFDYMLDEADSLRSDDPEITVLLAVVTKILFHVRKTDSIKIMEDELMSYIEKYALAISLEEITRKTDIAVEPPTLDNIFSRNTIKKCVKR